MHGIPYRTPYIQLRACIYVTRYIAIYGADKNVIDLMTAFFISAGPGAACLSI